MTRLSALLVVFELMLCYVMNSVFESEPWYCFWLLFWAFSLLVLSWGSILIFAFPNNIIHAEPEFFLPFIKSQSFEEIHFELFDSLTSTCEESSLQQCCDKACDRTEATLSHVLQLRPI